MSIRQQGRERETRKILWQPARKGLFILPEPRGRPGGEGTPREAGGEQGEGQGPETHGEESGMRGEGSCGWRMKRVNQEKQFK